MGSGGARVAVADVNGDGQAAMPTTAGGGLASYRLRVLNGWPLASRTSFHTLTPNFTEARCVAANDGTSGYPLWKSDGTEAGTVRVQDIV